MAIVTVLVVSITATLLSGEVKAWFPWLTKRLVALAVRILPEDERERYGEEWPSYLSEIPGEIGKILGALGFIFAGFGIRVELYGLLGFAGNHINDEAPENKGHAVFGLLPEPKRSPGSLITSFVINGAILAILFYLGATAKRVIDDHRTTQSQRVQYSQPVSQPSITQVRSAP